MDNLNELSAMVAPLLNDPQAMESLRRAAEQMGLGGILPENSPAGNAEEKEPGAVQSGDKTADMLSAVSKLAPLFAAGRDDDASRLLSALRPFLSQQRVRRLEEAERLLSIGRALSIIKESKLI